jgi:hypothetical protein
VTHEANNTHENSDHENSDQENSYYENSDHENPYITFKDVLITNHFLTIYYWSHVFEYKKFLRFENCDFYFTNRESFHNIFPILEELAIENSTFIVDNVSRLGSKFKVEDLPNLKKLVLIAPATEITRPIDSFSKFVALSDKVKQKMYNLIIRLAEKPVSYFDVRRAVQQISIPTLWLHDKEDTICPYEDIIPVQNMVLPHIKFHITEGLGHSNIYRDANTVKTIVHFLAN